MEKKATLEAISFAKEETLIFLASERERILKLSKEEAIREVLRTSKVADKIKTVISIKDNGLLNL